MMFRSFIATCCPCVDCSFHPIPRRIDERKRILPIECHRGVDAWIRPMGEKQKTVDVAVDREHSYETLDYLRTVMMLDCPILPAAS